MDEIEQNDVDIENNEAPEIEEAETPEEETPKREYSDEEKLERVSRMKAKLEKKLGIQPKVESDKAKKGTPGELDNADYAFLAVKGYEHDDDIALIKEKMSKWNLPLRELLKDEDIQNKLRGMRIEREAKAAIPGSTRRTQGSIADNEDYWFQKYEQGGKLPDNMPPGMAEKLVNRRYQQADPRKNPFE